MARAIADDKAEFQVTLTLRELAIINASLMQALGHLVFEGGKGSAKEAIQELSEKLLRASKCAS
jgi:hypothetical protein